VRHTWDRKCLSCSETELTDAFDEIRSKAFSFMEGLAEEKDSREGFAKICNSVYRAVMTSENTNPNWSKVQGKRGVYVVDFYPSSDTGVEVYEAEEISLNPHDRTIDFKSEATLGSRELCPLGSKAYYELEIMTNDSKCPRYGFASLAWIQRARARGRKLARRDEAEGECPLEAEGDRTALVGDDNQSWAVDGSRKMKWHGVTNPSANDQDEEQSLSERISELFHFLDKNKDGVLSMDEVNAFLESWVLLSDENRSDLPRGSIKSFFDHLDHDQNGEVSENEFLEFWKEMEDHNFIQNAVSHILRHLKQEGMYEGSWRAGDVLGFAVDLVEFEIQVSVNGSFDAPNGVVFKLESHEVPHGVFAAFTSGPGTKLRYNLGQTPFKHAPPSSDFKAFVQFESSERASIANSNQVPVVEDSGQFQIELDLQLLELRVSGGVLRSLDADIVGDKDVKDVLGKSLTTLQCVELRNSAECRERKIVGTKTELEIRAWRGHDKIQARTADREYAPLELSESEAWIADLFEPIRCKLFVKGDICKADVQFFLPDEPVSSDTPCVVLCAAHPGCSKKQGAWLNIVLLREFWSVEVYLIDSYGGQYMLSPQYTSNLITSNFAFPPDTGERNQNAWESGKRKKPWECWERHEAFTEKFFPEILKESEPENFLTTCTCTRSFAVEDSAGLRIKRREMFIPARYLNGLIPQALTDTFVFWQDESNQSVIRGYVKEEDGPLVEMKVQAICIELQRIGKTSTMVEDAMKKRSQEQAEILLGKITAALVMNPKSTKTLGHDAFGDLHGNITFDNLKSGLETLKIAFTEFEIKHLFESLADSGTNIISTEIWSKAIASADWESVLKSQGTDIEDAFLRREAMMKETRVDIDRLRQFRSAKLDLQKARDSNIMGSHGVYARVSRVLSDSLQPETDDSTEVLLNATHAPRSSTLWSLLRTLSKAEYASNLLVWGKEDANGECRVTRVEMKSLNASFTAKLHQGLGEEPRMLLFSDDLPNFFIADDALPSSSKTLVDGLPQMLVLCSLHHEWCILVPNRKVIRPLVKPRPFSCELVFDPDDDWRKNINVAYFTYKLHPSGLSLIPQGLSAAFYLLVLQMLLRDYTNASALISRISTDASLNMQETQIIKLLEQAAEDEHPDAIACRIKIELALADCPVGLPWDIRVEGGIYFSKLRHISAICRLSQREEMILVSLCKDCALLHRIVSDGVSRYAKESVQNWTEILLNKNYRKENSAKTIEDAEALVTTLLEMVHAKRGHHLDRDKLLLILKHVKNRDPPAWAAVLNREKYLQAKEKGEDSAKIVFTPRHRAGGWHDYANTRIMTSDSKAFNGLRVKYGNYEKFRGVEAVDFAVSMWSEGDCETVDYFLILYQVLCGTAAVSLLDSPPHTYGALLFYMAIEDCRKGGVFGSILGTLYNNPILCADMKCPKLNTAMIDGEPDDLYTDPMAHAPHTPLRTLLEDFAAFVKDPGRKDSVFYPTKFSAPQFARKGERTVSIKENVPLLDECPVAQVADFQLLSRQVSVPWTSPSFLTRVAQERLQALYDETVLNERPLYARLASFLVKKESKIVPSTIPLDVDTLLKDSSLVEKDMISRLKDDFETLHTISKDEDNAIYELIFLHGRASDLARGKQELLNEAIAAIDELSKKLKEMKSNDLAFFKGVQEAVVEVANGGGDDVSTKALRLKLLRISSHRPLMTFSFLQQSLLSSRSDEWQCINPFIDSETVSAASNLLCVAMLHAIRASSVNLALSQLHLLRLQLDQLKEAEPGQEDNVPIVLQQMSSALGEVLGARRTYIDKTTGEFKPQFLIFEFQTSMMLRVRQVEIVNEIYNAIEIPRTVGQSSTQSAACVKQMIMGSGKTTVVSPLLVLLFGPKQDQKSLVLQVMPPALLDFSRGVMRQALSDSVGKRVCTLTFDRSDPVDSRLFHKLNNAATSGAVVMTTPSAIKSIMLKTVENMLGLRDPGNLKKKQLQRQVKEASRLFSLLKDSVIIMDEVDMILHPLRSELNFPIGTKEPLGNAPMRWKFPVYLLDFFLIAGSEDSVYASHVKDSAMTVKQQEILKSMREALQEAAKSGAVSKRPHWVLVSSEFYAKTLRPLFLQISLLYCEKQGIKLKEHDWIESYLGVDQIDAKSPTPAEKAFQSWGSDIETTEEILVKTIKQDKERLNMIRTWLHLVLPHILQKVDRVSFGLMNEQDCKRALKNDPRMPRSRLNLAIPFVGKDAPSAASEFAHPDVTLGLTILAYRYEGLRLEHMKEILRALKAKWAKEIGPPEKRPSALKFQEWVFAAGGSIVKCAGPPGDGSIAVLSLDRLRPSNLEQLTKTFRLLRLQSAVIEYFLLQIFPTYMKYQQLKISASAQELGSDMLFSRRIGFSGTPSSLIPHDLNGCQFEPGSEASILQTLSDTNICGVLEEDNKEWSAASVLDRVIAGKFHSLIDTGALVTGFSNLEVAQYLLKLGRYVADSDTAFKPASRLQDRGIHGVVYLDEADRKMVLLAESGASVKLDECGLQLDQRFAFYDQIHTTGMDIKHTPNARALITFGKDMVLRDLAQGAYRMRGIGKGQTVDFYIVPEVQRLVEPFTPEESNTNTGMQQKLRRVLMWLLANSLRTEKMQFSQLQIQNSANVFRKTAFGHLIQASISPSQALHNESFCKSLDVFREQVLFDITADLPIETTLLDKIDNMEKMHGGLLSESEKDRTTVKNIRDSLSQDFHVGAHLEQEQEQVTSATLTLTATLTHTLAH